jgi:hypothetical protein
MPTARDIAVWQRIISASWDDLPAETAEGILQLTFSERDLQRMSELSDRATELPLRPGEQAELENYATVSRILGLMHSRARRALTAGGRPRARARGTRK